MAEYVAGRGTTGMSIAGLVTGIIGTLGAGGGLMANGIGTADRSACMHDVYDAKELAEKDAIIARLEAERYADKVRDDAKEYGIQLYKQFEGEIRRMEREYDAKWAEQGITNAHFHDAIKALDNKASGTANLVDEITRTAVKRSAICDFDSRSCGGCGNNI